MRLFRYLEGLPSTRLEGSLGCKFHFWRQSVNMNLLLVCRTLSITICWFYWQETLKTTTLESQSLTNWRGTSTSRMLPTRATELYRLHMKEPTRMHSSSESGYWVFNIHPWYYHHWNAHQQFEPGPHQTAWVSPEQSCQIRIQWLTQQNTKVVKNLNWEPLTVRWKTNRLRSFNVVQNSTRFF